MKRPLSFATNAIHAGQPPDPSHGAVMLPVVLSTTFAQPSPGRPLHFDYSRSGNPTRAALEACLAALEEGTRGFAFASGCAAALTVLQTLRPGDHIVSGDDVYGGTHRLLDRVIAPLGIASTYVDLNDLDALERAISPNTRLVWLETPTNPLLKLFDIAAVSAIAHGHGAKVVVDNTFASPALQRPLTLGADVVTHSTTKYLNGHSDVVGGAIITRNEELAAKLGFLQNAMGAVPSPFDCYLVLRGIKTLPIRMQQHVRTANEIARRLERAPGVVRVRYPGLTSHPQYDLGLRQMSGGGGMLSFELSGGLEAARRFLEGLQVFALAESLGGVESLAEHPALMTHASISPEIRDELGISAGLVRLSLGLEDVDDLWADIEEGLERANRV